MIATSVLFARAAPKKAIFAAAELKLKKAQFLSN